jgi:hypothetical protein
MRSANVVRLLFAIQRSAWSCSRLSPQRVEVLRSGVQDLGNLHPWRQLIDVNSSTYNPNPSFWVRFVPAPAYRGAEFSQQLQVSHVPARGADWRWATAIHSSPKSCRIRAPTAHPSLKVSHHISVICLIALHPSAVGGPRHRDSEVASSQPLSSARCPRFPAAREEEACKAVQRG